jgi:dethiobiotin synthase
VSAYFVTSTGTDIGKTFVTAGLIRYLRQSSQPVAALKPVVSGYDSSVVETSDPAVLLRALGRPVSADEIAAIAPFRFRAPLSPDIAAAREGRSIEFDDLLKFSRDAVAANSGLTFIEGVGGIMVPIDAERTVLDWMAALGLPVILVVGGYLCASKPVIDLMRNRARTLVYSTGLPPPTVAAAIAALDLIEHDPTLVSRPVQKAQMFTRLTNLPEAQSPIVPVIVGSEENALAVSHMLSDQGFHAAAIRPPTVPEGTSRLRFTFTADHPEAEIERLAGIVRSCVLDKALARAP